MKGFVGCRLPEREEEENAQEDLLSFFFLSEVTFPPASSCGSTGPRASEKRPWKFSSNQNGKKGNFWYSCLVLTSACLTTTSCCSRKAEKKREKKGSQSSKISIPLSAVLKTHTPLFSFFLLSSFLPALAEDFLRVEYRGGVSGIVATPFLLQGLAFFQAKSR